MTSAREDHDNREIEALKVLRGDNEDPHERTKTVMKKNKEEEKETPLIYRGRAHPIVYPTGKKKKTKGGSHMIVYTRDIRRRRKKRNKRLRPAKTSAV